jgi:hypothetical protein
VEARRRCALVDESKRRVEQDATCGHGHGARRSMERRRVDAAWQRQRRRADKGGGSGGGSDGDESEIQEAGRRRSGGRCCGRATAVGAGGAWRSVEVVVAAGGPQAIMRAKRSGRAQAQSMGGRVGAKARGWITQRNGRRGRERAWQQGAATATEEERQRRVLGEAVVVRVRVKSRAGGRGGVGV